MNQSFTSNIVRQVLLQIIQANPTKYSNTHKKSLNSRLEKMRHDIPNKSLQQKIKLEEDIIVQKINIVQAICLEYGKMDLELEECI